MKFEVTAELGYDVGSSGTLILNFNALKTPKQLIFEEKLVIEPFIWAEELASFNSENRFIRLRINEPANIRIFYQAKVESTFAFTNHTLIPDIPVPHLDASVIPYLYPSRYCQSDKLFRLANNKFGHYINPFEQVLAITNWINQNVAYLSGITDAQTSAYDTVAEQAGVCRDFAHLGIALCRALTIPARYFTGYAYNLFPPDFHACFEAYLGNQWVIFDATRLAPLNGLVKIGTGRDAADTAIANIFGDITFNYMTANCRLLEEYFTPFFYDPYAYTGISYS